jgi:putative membrane protein
MMHDYWNYGGGNDMWGVLYMFFWLVLIVIGAVITLHYLRNEKISPRQEDGALDLLKKRYAKGEIDKKEFEEKRKDLSK